MVQTPRIPDITYDQDYQLWLQQTLEKLRLRDYMAVDWEHLIDEIESMGKRDRHRLKSNLIILLMHLLQWDFQAEKRSGSWESTIIEHRRRIIDELEDSPSLRPYLQQILASAYTTARQRTKAETGLSQDSFPQESPYDLEQILGLG
ncbi:MULTISPECIES: DUF29 domain-containing protein [Cyanophyceae]|uniref:DUF29 domain-containing protein n=1 Tax=Cyanophyceae TaxID=3028117 RepID=UPI00016DCAF0|nr:MULTISPECIES: DUF29 domain-containing protein [Cyanophyceae]ACA99645.1 Conserved hypothetical protein (DUF29) [Picosynechococcus sp. PCC 7002]SMH28581.1 protein of unknown function DUF29 [Picosynechococcus sp. OG1]SMQ83596.1 protein of unknown function DUF29 [Synechococcus sp. 7002]